MAARPRISILIPARNEAGILAASLPSILKQEYDNYEVILVDDASSDGTPELVKPFLERFPDKLRVIRVDELPVGWNGKIHALHTAFQEARGEWVLATDADIVFHPKALQAGLWLARKQQADLVTIFAFVECVSFWEKMMLPGFSLLLATFFPFRKINDSNSSVAVASGGYILMCRDMWARLGGYQAIRSEMIDDLNTARIVKHSGHRIFAVTTRDLLSTRMYESFEELWEGLRKHAFAGNRYSVARMFAALGGMGLVNILPLACLLYASANLLFPAVGAADIARLWEIMVLAGSQYLLESSMNAPFVHFLGINLGYALLAPLGALVYVFISIDSMMRTLFGPGVTWKLRQYRKPPHLRK